MNQATKWAGFLAKALREHTYGNTIMSIKWAKGSLDVTTEAIARYFHTFYTNFYNLSQQHRQPGLTGDRAQIIRDFLDKSGLPSLDDLDANTLKSQIDVSDQER